MKKLILTLITLALLNLTFAQEIIDLQGNIISEETMVEAKRIEIEIINPKENKQYEISALINQVELGPLSIPQDSSVAKIRSKGKKVLKTLKFNLKRGERLTVVVKEYTPGNEDPKVVIRKYVTRSRGKWQTTFGFNMVWVNADTYFSEQQEDGTFLISPSEREQNLDFHPTVMFTWLGFGKKNSEIKDSNVGLSAGFGYDLEESFSLFSGLSYVYNQNLTFTIGAAFVHQEELNRQYSGGDMITENLDFDQLHEEFLRIRPFLSVSLRLDKSPF